MIFRPDVLFCSYPPHQQSVTVHRNGHAGHKGHIVLAVHNLKVGGIGGYYFFNLIYCVMKVAVVDMDDKFITFI